MEAVITIISYLIVILGFSLVFFISIDHIVDKIHRRKMERQRAVASLARVEVGRDLKTISHWFSEDPNAMKVVQLIGQALVDGKNLHSSVEVIRREYFQVRDCERRRD